MTAATSVQVPNDIPTSPSYRKSNLCTRLRRPLRSRQIHGRASTNPQKHPGKSLKLPNWAPSFVNKAKQRPKIHAVDTGLACDALGVGVDALARPGSEAAGPLLETFVVNELLKQRGWNDTRVELHHFRDREGREVDVVLQARDGTVAAVEVKAARDVDEHDVRWLAWLRDRLGDRFVRGVILHLGDRPMPFGDRITAMPVSALWSEW